MSNATVDTAWAVTASSSQGGGGLYDRAIRAGGGLLAVAAADELSHPTTPLDISAFVGAATGEEREVLALTEGSLLDVGCGPGRLVRAALDAHRPALGIDVSQAAVAHALSEGLPVLRRSVFDPIPGEGSWGTVVLLDGNIGIGGEPEVLLERCAVLLGASGQMVVESHADLARDSRFRAQLVDESGVCSAFFPWAEVGATTIRSITADLGLATTTVLLGRRTFVIASR